MRHNLIVSYPFVPGKRDALGRPVQEIQARCTCKQWSAKIKTGFGERERTDEAFNFHLVQVGQRQ